MKLSHKVAKLVDPLTYRRTWRRLRRFRYPLPMAPLLAQIDHTRLAELRKRHGSPPANAPQTWHHYTKYLDVEKYLPLNIRRVQDLDLHRTSPFDVLDIGCGAGFFLFVAQACGHRVRGLDVAGVPVFDDLVELLHVERTIGEIRAYELLGDLGREFDLITAFSTVFHRTDDYSSHWGVKEWEFLLDDLEKHLKPGGRIFFGLNPEYQGNYYTPEILKLFQNRGASIERENVLFPLKPLH